MGVLRTVNGQPRRVTDPEVGFIGLFVFMFIA
jgi:hypothetical protein